jgi:hypothetical protein
MKSKIDPTQVIMGSILGDGSLSPLSRGRDRTSTIDISQNVSKFSYLEWLYKILGRVLDLNPIHQKKGFEQMYRFRSKPSKLLGSLRSKFYSDLDGKKIIPSDIQEIFKDPISLAVWYMDDGTLDKRDKYHFNSCLASYCFTFSECNFLKEVLKKNFGLNVSVNQSTMRGKVYPRIYIRSESMNDFIRLVKPHILPVFNYKIGL